MNKLDIANKFNDVQTFICSHFEKLDPSLVFSSDVWAREGGGGGNTMTGKNGQIISKAGVAFSEVYGEITDSMRNQLQMDGKSFFATGVSSVIHPKHPLHPIIHMNIRYFEMDDHTYWFGGGIDLTPHYIDIPLAVVFHQQLKDICDKYNPKFYEKFKTWADDYFYLPHRKETRGIGGIFFDQLNTSQCALSKDVIFQFCTQLGEMFPKLYAQQIIESKKVEEPTKNQLEWQKLRRGRYVEFNLLHDRGTKFGIYSGGRTESILLSMPPEANWEYNYKPMPYSQEEKTLELLRKNIDWLAT